MTKHARVAKVLENGDVVINQGSNADIAPDQTFVIYERGEEITDPDTGESLGVLELVKGRAQVSHVQEKMAILHILVTEERRSKTLSEVMATISGKDESETPPEVVVGDYAKPDPDTT